MAIIREMDIVEEQVDKAKQILKQSREMVQQMQNIVFCMEVEVAELKKELELRQSKLEVEIHE